jgi:cation diffusion facilitator family transporter
MAAAGGRRAIVAALFANLGIAIAKFVGYLATGAASMLAEAVHSVADSSNQALLLWGSNAARREPTEEHPFGFGQERYFWSFVVALVLFSLGSLFAIYEGVNKLQHPHALASPLWAVAILVVAIGLETFSFRTAVVESRPLLRGRSWWRFIRTSKQPELPVVLLEDLGALVGLCLALAGVGLAALTGDARWDALGSIAIGALLGVIAVVLAIEMKSLLIGEAAAPENQQKIRAALLADEAVRRVIHLRTLHQGPDQLLVAAKVEFAGELPFRDVAQAIDEAEERVREQVPIARLIFVEPDVWKPPPPDAA